MYPFEADKISPKNRWYIAAYSSEISIKPFERSFFNIPVALYRTEAGKVVAMYGLCPHRYYPLAKGEVRGDAIVCGYHGFQFDAKGKCVCIPSQKGGANFEQPTYPLVEKGYLTWIWMGDPEKADPNLIPPYEDFGLDQPGWAVSGGDYFHLKARAQLLIDNIMDLTHLPHIHHHVPGGDTFLSGKRKVVETDFSLRQLHVMTDQPWSDFFNFLWGQESATSNTVTINSMTDFYGPELVRISGPWLTDRGVEVEDSFSETTHGKVNFIHGMTPETDNSTHYFGMQTRNFRIDDQPFGKALGAVDVEIRLQDVDAIEAVEARVEWASARQQELVVVADRMASRVRQKIKNMLDLES
ncbi:Rieske 2Fe-2S domain-containing protein [Pseudomaricurvus alcaniphilus]|uniref:aromatic ring-hydroxylating dioxygenase subunit alpha n=1 Tax=Pseudomaricurvus alcaniphilus TaxID=1166482 RepID=UPI00140DE1DD|nr:aromatic ring-hydroxylating dioxygenase subunit alpha [Pseudomaricurvus alcaniphilus]NHN39963.1 Rieske 2Fe-2S domain-containing protein [Pseudomaricurvus alcaniphilus]